MLGCFQSSCFPAQLTINWSFFSAPHPIVFWNKFYLLSPSQQALSQVTFVLILRSAFVLLYLNQTAAPQIHLECLLGEQGMLIGLRTSRGMGCAEPRRPKNCGRRSKWNLALHTCNENVLTALFQMTLNLGFWGSRIYSTQIILLASFMCLLEPNGTSNISDKRFSEGSTGNVIFLRSVSCKHHN